MLDRFLRDCRVSVRNEVKIQKLVIIFISFNDDLDGRPLCFCLWYVLFASDVVGPRSNGHRQCGWNVRRAALE